MSNEMLLIVEDEYAIAELLEMVLTDGGYRVMIAANGRQGLERLAQDAPPDLVISDFMMPVLDGARFLHAMRETEAHRNIPCIIMSSVPEASVRRHIDGYAGFIRKPFMLTDMVQLVARVLDTERQAGREDCPPCRQ
jgi:CheY-like chemotaxis protein